MPYGTIKVDTITFTSGGTDVSVPISGLVQNPTFTGNVTVTGTISGTTVRGNTVSGATITGTAGQFAALTGDTAGFTTLTGTTVTGTNANFNKVSGTTVTGNAAQFTTLTGGTAGFTTVTGTTVTGTTANFATVSGTNITGSTIVATTQVSGATVTGTAAQFTNITGVTIVGTTTVSGATVTGTTASFAGTATASGFVPTGSGVPTNGLYLPSGNTVGISTSGTAKLVVDPAGKLGLGNTSPTALFHVGDGTVASTQSPHIYLCSENGADQVACEIRQGRFNKDALVVTSNQSLSANLFQAIENGTSRFAIQGGGTVLVGVTSANANGGVLQLKSGITFPATKVDATDPNTLDDYEEGSWTPQFFNGAVQDTGAFVTGIYKKIGSLVIVEGALAWGGGSGAGNYPAASASTASIRNLPFTRQDPQVGGGFSQYGFTPLGGTIRIVGGTSTVLNPFNNNTGATNQTYFVFQLNGSSNSFGWASSAACSAISGGNDVIIAFNLMYSTTQ